MKAVLKMNVSDGAVLEFDVNINMRDGVFKARINDQNLYTGEGETIEDSVNDLLFQMNTVSAQDIKPQNPAPGPKAG